MKKMYLTPLTEVTEMELLPLMAGSGPNGGDASTPGVSEDSDDGPVADDHGGTPGFGNSRYHKDMWEDDEI